MRDLLSYRDNLLIQTHGLCVGAVTGMIREMQIIWMCLNWDYNCDDHISISSVFPQFKLASFHVSFVSRVEMNSINWSAPNTCMGLHSSVSRAALTQRPWVRIPLKPWKCFLQLLKRLQLLWSSHFHFICIAASSFHISLNQVELMSDKYAI